MRTPARHLALAIIALAACLAATTAPPAAASKLPPDLDPDPFWFVLVEPGKSDQGMFNFDFLCKRQECASRNHVSFPVTLIFYNNAEIDRVKQDINMATGNFRVKGSEKHSLQRDTSRDSTARWDDDGGRKDCDNTDYPFNSCKSKCVNHYRIYADPLDDKQYSTKWGYWVYASTHADCLENTDKQYFGYSEHAAEAVAEAAQKRQGWGVVRNSVNMHNPINFASEEASGPHYLTSDGWATAIRVP